jgi:hypothetical protein
MHLIGLPAALHSHARWALAWTIFAMIASIVSEGWQMRASVFGMMPFTQALKSLIVPVKGRNGEEKSERRKQKEGKREGDGKNTVETPETSSVPAHATEVAHADFINKFSRFVHDTEASHVLFDLRGRRRKTRSKDRHTTPFLFPSVTVHCPP